MKSHLRLLLLGLLMLCVSPVAHAQVLLHYWNFNNSTSVAAQLTPSAGTGGSLLYTAGGTSAIQLSSNTTGQGFETSNLNARNGDAAGSHLRLNNPIGSSLTFNLPTTGHEEVVVKYATRRSGSGAGTQNVSYSTDGVTFTFLRSVFPVDANPVIEIFDFSAISAASNNPSFKLKIEFEQGTAGTVGNNRFDNFTLDARVQGVVLPPVITASTLTGSRSVRLIFNQDLSAVSATTLSNYTGIGSLDSVVMTQNGTLKDTVYLYASTPFTSGQTYNLVASGVQNAQGVSMASAYTFTFNYQTTVTFAKRYHVAEENSGSYSIELNVGSPANASFRARIQTGSQIQSGDHGFTEQIVQLTSTSTTASIVVPINDDAQVEDDEFLIIGLDSLTGVNVVGATFFTLYIRDNDRTAPVAANTVTMTHVGSFDPSTLGSTCEVLAYDRVSKRLFVSSSIQNRFDIINYANPAQPVTISGVDMTPYGKITSLAVKPGLLAVASPNVNEQLPGSVVFFDTLGNFISQVTVGALPDMITFSPDGNLLLVANEAQPNTTFTNDPEGSVSVIQVSGTISQASVTILDFQSFNAQEAQLIASGVRKGSTIGTLSQNLEPEFITVSPDNSKAWVTLQENNTIAEINLTNLSVTALRPLGLRDNSQSGYGFDASDNIPEVLLVNWPTHSYYMPDAIANFSVGGQTYLITANEGDEREYSALNERTTVGATTTVLNPATFANPAQLKETHALGRLRITNQNGDIDGDGDYDQLITVGPRSFSIWNAASGAQVFDSKNELEVITSTHPVYGHLFNADNENNTRKSRSRAKGPEPEGVAIANVQGRIFAFVCLERTGGVVAYDVTDPANPVYQGYLNTRNLASLGGDLGPETLTYIPAESSADGQAYLLVANEISGTVTSIRLNFNIPPAFTLQILHASDLEAGLTATTDAPRFAAVIDTLRRTHPNTVLLSSGDNFIPSPFLSASEDPSMQTPLRNAASRYYTGTQAVRAAIGRTDIAMMNLMGFQAAVFGNHEFDLGTSELNGMIGVDIRSSGADKRWLGAQFPYLSSNLNFSGDINLSYLLTADGQEHTNFRTSPTITANSQKKGIARSTVITVNGEKIGIVGATTQILASISSPGATTMVGPQANDMPALANILQPVIDSLRFGQGINKIILLAHLQQIELETALAPLLSGVDVIVSGGSNTLLADGNDVLRVGQTAAGTYPRALQNADGEPLMLVNTDGEYRYVGRLQMGFDAQGRILPHTLDSTINGAYATDSAGVARLWGSTQAAFADANGAPAQVKLLCDAIQNVIVAKDGNLFGRSNVFLEGRRNLVRTEETNLGNITADANLWAARKVIPDVAISLKNGGGIRSAMGEVYAVGSQLSLLATSPNAAANKQRGDISQLDIENSLRFNNRLSVLTIPVSGIKALIEHSVAATTATSSPGQFPQVSGLRFSFDPAQPAGSKIRNMALVDSAGHLLDSLVYNGNVIGNPARTYKMVTLNFLAGGGDSYPFAPYASTRMDLDTMTASTPGTATFTVPGSEQDAFAEFMLARYPVTAPYSIEETPASADLRIQNLTRRTDSVYWPLPAPVVAMGQISGCVGQIASVPVNVQNFVDISAVTLTFSYDTTALTYVGYSDTALTNNLIINEPSPRGTIILSWYSLTPVNLGNARLMNLNFMVHSTAGVNFNFSNPSGNELANSNGEAIVGTQFENGAIQATQGPAITSHPASRFSLNLGANGTLSVTATNADGYQWQVSSNGTHWSNLSDGAGYAGATTATLSITAGASMNGNQYRVQVTGGGCPAAISSASLLTVILPPTVSIGQVNGCRGQLVAVPLQVQSFNDISAVTLHMRYDTAALTYVGYADTALTGNLIVNVPSQGGLVIVTWFSLTPVNINNGLLMNLNFITRGSSAISFDVSDPGNNELANSNGDPIATSVFTNGGVTASGAVITGQPAATLSLNTASTGTLSVTAAHADTYEWQVSTDGINWSTLSNGAGYAGATTATLSITAAVAMNGNQYRVRVSGAGCPAVVSSSSHLTVILPPAVNIGQVNGCRGQLVAVPLQVQDFNDISAVTLNIRYDTAALTYVGYSNTALTGNLIVNAPGQGGLVIVSWYSLTSVNISNGLLMNLNFITRGSSAITFDLSDPAYNELASSSGDPIANTSFTNGGITASGAVITGQPAASLTVNVGATDILSVTAAHADTYQWQVSTDGTDWSNLTNGAGYAGATTASLSITAGASMNGNQYRVVVSSAGCPDVVSTTSTLNIPSQAVSGIISYDNSTSTGIPAAVVELTNTSTQQTYTATADAQGQYAFASVPGGTYTLRSTSALPWPRANATDALMVARHHASIMFLSGLRWSAADVNASNNVNSGDALQILQRGIRIINQFTAGDWLSEQRNVTVGVSALSEDLKMLGYGDVNGNAYPGNQRLAAPQFRLLDREVRTLEDLYAAEFRLAEAANLGALTLHIQLPEGVQVNMVRRSGLEGGNLEYHQEGRTLSIGWFATYGVELKAGEPLFELITDSDLSNTRKEWHLLAETELADMEGRVISRSRLDVALPATTDGGILSVGQVYPNPGQGNGRIDVRLVRASELTLRIWDATGRLVQAPAEYRLTPGNHELVIEGLTAGHYRVEIQANDQETRQQIYRPMVVVR